jgi:hypothetical protein
VDVSPLLSIIHIIRCCIHSGDLKRATTELATLPASVSQFSNPEGHLLTAILHDALKRPDCSEIVMMCCDLLLQLQMRVDDSGTRTFVAGSAHISPLKLLHDLLSFIIDKQERLQLALERVTAIAPNSAAPMQVDDGDAAASSSTPEDAALAECQKQLCGYFEQLVDLIKQSEKEEQELPDAADKLNLEGLEEDIKR